MRKYVSNSQTREMEATRHRGTRCPKGLILHRGIPHLIKSAPSCCVGGSVRSDGPVLSVQVGPDPKIATDAGEAIEIRIFIRLDHGWRAWCRG